MSDDDIINMLSIEPAGDALAGAFNSSNDSTNPHCVVCGLELTYGGRGPKPKYCDEHRKQKAPSGGSRSTRTSKDLIGIEQALAVQYAMMGTVVGFFNPSDGMEIAGHADELAHSWIVAAETNPKILKALQRMSTGGALTGVIIAHLMVAFPIAVNHGLLDKVRVNK